MWFADAEDPDTADPRWPWQPVLQLDGMTFTGSAHFATKEDCETFIRANLVGTGWMDGPVNNTCPACGAVADEWCRREDGTSLMAFHQDRLLFMYGGWPS
jgi:hypothetical protein